MLKVSTRYKIVCLKYQGYPLQTTNTFTNLYISNLLSFNIIHGLKEYYGRTFWLINVILVSNADDLLTTKSIGNLRDHVFFLEITVVK